jgi:hypothetical protein
MATLRRIGVLPAVLVLWASVAAPAPPAAPGVTPTGAADPLMSGYVYNIVDWDGGQLPPRYERSDQLPLALADVRKLSQSGFSEDAIVEMLQERRCACDASVDALVQLKEARVSERVIRAVSLHALAPNRSVYLVVTIDLEGLGGSQQVSDQARRGYLYLIVPDGSRERVFMADLATVMQGAWRHDSMVDGTDLLLPRKVRRIVFSAEVPLKEPGPREALVFTSARPNIFASADIPAADQADVQRYAIDYPVSSLQRICDLQVVFGQDQMLADKWHLIRTHFQCEWD